MPETVLQIDPRDNVLVALAPLAAGTTVHYGQFRTPVPSPRTSLPSTSSRSSTSSPATWSSCTAWWSAKPPQAIARGGLLSTRNVRHRAGGYTAQRHPVSFALPDASAWTGRDLHGLSPRRRPGRHAQLLARASARLLREPQRRPHAGSTRRRTRLRQFAQQLSASGAPAGRNASAAAMGMTRPTRPQTPTRSRLSQHRRHPLPHPPGRLRRHAPGRAGALRLARRLHSSSQRRRRHRAQPWLPECAGKHADGRTARARPQTHQTGPRLRSATLRPRNCSDDRRARPDIRWPRRSQSRHAARRLRSRRSPSD